MTLIAEFRVCYPLPMNASIRILVNHINRKNWWHVQPRDPKSYERRGKFFSSNFAEAQFYGRPVDTPDKVKIARPIVGDNDTIERKLLGRVESSPDIRIRSRLSLDAKLRRAASERGYDSIVLMTAHGYDKFKREGKIPRSIELNIVDLRCLKP